MGVERTQSFLHASAPVISTQREHSSQPTHRPLTHVHVIQVVFTQGWTLEEEAVAFEVLPPAALGGVAQPPAPRLSPPQSHASLSNSSSHDNLSHSDATNSTSAHRSPKLNRLANPIPRRMSGLASSPPAMAPIALSAGAVESIQDDGVASGRHGLPGQGEEAQIVYVVVVGLNRGVAEEEALASETLNEVTEVR